MAYYDIHPSIMGHRTPNNLLDTIKYDRIQLVSLFNINIRNNSVTTFNPVWHKAFTNLNMTLTSHPESAVFTQSIYFLLSVIY